VTNFYRIWKNSFSFQPCDDGGRVIKAISMRAMTSATLSFHEGGGKALIADLKTF
jgi:hypothetical protein